MSNGARDFYAPGRPDRRAPVRQRVAEHLLARHPPGPVSLLSLPGAEWAFERVLRAAMPPARPLAVVGVERDRAVAARALAGAPPGVAAALAEAPASAYLAGPPDRLFTAVWLDTCNALSDELHACLRLLPRWLAPGVVPVAVTFFPSRDAGTALAGRVRPGPRGTAVARRAAALLEVMAAHRPVAASAVLEYRDTSLMGVLLAAYHPTPLTRE